MSDDPCLDDERRAALVDGSVAGRPWRDADVEHLARCADCRRDVLALAAAVGPSNAVWGDERAAVARLLERVPFPAQREVHSMIVTAEASAPAVAESEALARSEFPTLPRSDALARDAAPAIRSPRVPSRPRLVAGAAAAALAVCALLTAVQVPTYSATALLLIEPSTASATSNAADGAYYQTALAELASERIARLAWVRLQGKPLASDAPAAEEAVERFRRTITVSGGRNRLFEVSCMAPDAAQAARAANALCEAYIGQLRKRRGGLSDDVIRQLKFQHERSAREAYEAVLPSLQETERVLQEAARAAATRPCAEDVSFLERAKPPRLPGWAHTALRLGLAATSALFLGVVGVLLVDRRRARLLAARLRSARHRRVEER